MAIATVVTPARRRFRRGMAILAALGVALFGLVPVGAAHAAPVAVTITVTTQGTIPVQDNMFFVNVEGVVGPSVDWDTSDSSGQVHVDLEPGTYDIYSAPGTRYDDSRVTFTVLEGGPQTFAADIDTRPIVTGSVTPSYPADQVGINVYQWEGSYWRLDSPAPWTPDDSGNFEIWFSDTGGQWTLQFVPGDSHPYMTTWLGGAPEAPANLDDPATFFTLGGNNTTVAVDPTALLASGIVSGTVIGLSGAPIEGAYVVADEDLGDQLAETQTNSSGEYTLKVPLDVQFTVRAYEDDWQHQYYNEVWDIDNAWLLEVTSADPLETGIDFDLFPEVETHFEFFTGEGPDREEFFADFSLYYDAGHGYSPIPFDVDFDESATGFSELRPGDYRFGLKPTDEDQWIPFDTLNTLPGDIAGSTDECYFEFTVDGSITEFEFELTALPEGTCDDAPWLEGADEPGVVTGTVTNADDVAGGATAVLYVLDEYGDPIEVVSTPVDGDGEFELYGVYVDGEYFVGIDTPRDDPHIPLLVGVSDEIPLWDLYDIDIDGFDLTGNADLEDLEITLPGAWVLSGIVTSGGTPVDDACVLLIDVNDDVIQCSPTDSNGQYWLKAPVSTTEPPTALQYWIVAESDLGLPTFWGDDPIQGDPIAVLESGVDPFSYDIEILSVPSLAFGFASQLDATNNPEPIEDGTAHLYRKSGSSWVAVETFPMLSDDDEGVSMFGFPAELLDFFLAEPEDINDLDAIFAALFAIESLPVGDYRIWFSQNDEWLPIASYEMDQASIFEGYIDDASVTDEGCYLEFSNAEIGTWTIFEPVLIDADIDLDCAPPTSSGGGGPTTPKPPTKTPVGGVGSNQQTDTPDDEGTDDGTDEGESDGETPGTLVPTNPTTPTPSPTPDPSADDDPNAQGPDLTWLWWLGGILLLLVIAGGTVLVIRRP